MAEGLHVRWSMGRHAPGEGITGLPLRPLPVLGGPMLEMAIDSI